MRSGFLVTLFVFFTIGLSACAVTPAATPDTPSMPLPESTATITLPPEATHAPAILQETPAQSTPTFTPTPAELPDGKQLVDDFCTVCHSIERVSASKKSPAEWQATVERMLGYATERGKFEFTPEQEQAIILYLGETYR